jgi:hypothetical protein
VVDTEKVVNKEMLLPKNAAHIIAPIPPLSEAVIGIIREANGALFMPDSKWSIYRPWKLWAK